MTYYVRRKGQDTEYKDYDTAVAEAKKKLGNSVDTYLVLQGISKVEHQQSPVQITLLQEPAIIRGEIPF